MALVVKNRVLETSTSTGTGDFTLAGAVTGFKAFSAVCATNDVFPYVIEGLDSFGYPTGEWEVGYGTYSATNTLTRTCVVESSNSNAAVSFSAGTKRVSISPIAQAGTAFPSSPVTGQRFLRTDRNIEYYYDGTRWLSSQLFSLEFSGNDITADGHGTDRCAVPYKGTYDLYIVSYQLSHYVNASASWNFKPSWATQANVLTAFGTHASGTASQWNQASGTVNALLDSTAYMFVMDFDEVTGTATAYAFCSLFYRLVG